MQLAAAHDTTTTEDAYLNVIGAKTAALFSAAAEIGAVIAERPKEEQAALESFGRNLGIAFQLIDDALDYSGKQSLMGKSVGDDFREGKITLPVVLAYRRGSGEERNFWKRTLEEREQQEEDLAQAQKLIERHGAISDTIERAKHYGAIAHDALAIFPAGAHKAALLEAVRFCIARVH
jgi:octaprenyl-diphosphate synthase